MDAQDLLPHRPALIGAAVALVIGVAGGLILKTGSQTEPQAYADFIPEEPTAQVEQISWPSGKLPDYVIGTDFLKAQQPYQPVVAASYPVPEYALPVWEELAAAPAAVQPIRMEAPRERAWPSTHGDILDVSLSDDAPAAPAPLEAVEAPETSEAPAMSGAPVALAAAAY